MRINDLLFNQQQFFVSFYLDAGTVVGDAVTHTGAGRVGRGADGAPLTGKVLKIEGDVEGSKIGTVAIRGAGFSDLPAVGTLALGHQLLVVDGAGKVKVGANGSRHLVNGAANGTANIHL